MIIFISPYNGSKWIIILGRVAVLHRCGLLLQIERRGLSDRRLVCLSSEPGKNGWIDRDAVWVE